MTNQTTLQMPLFSPETTWSPPFEFPDLKNAPRIALDLETCDPNLKTKGCGALRKDGFIAGVAVATESFKGYYPIRHFGGGNFDEKVVISWLKGQLNGTQPKVGANLLYDLEWLAAYGVQINGPVHDVQVAEPLLDEESLKGYSLEVLANKYLGNGKFETELRDAAQAFGVDPKSELWKMPAKHVGKYAEYDASCCLEIIDLQLKQLEHHKLLPIWQLECDLIPILLKMKLQGVRVDLSKAQELRDTWVKREKVLQHELDVLTGMRLNVWSANDLGKYTREKLNGEIFPQYTESTMHKPEKERTMSFTADWVKQQGHPFFKKVQEIRSLSKMRRDFVESMILENQLNGRIHTQFHQLKKDEQGTRSGRFSSTNPNLQQVPSRDKVLAPMIRGLFIPEDGCQWAKLDYSQQEPRVLLHYACVTGLDGAADIKEKYLSDPKTDWYKIIQDGASLSRKDSKDATLGRFYGMGIKTFCSRYQKTEEEGYRILNAFDRLFPFVRELSDRCMNKAQASGFIKTILGRHRHFNKWAAGRGTRPDGTPYNTHKTYDTMEDAKLDQPGANLVRAFVHKALNSLIQGSSGDMMKKAMVDIYKETGKTAHLTVHDELDFSVESKLQAITFKTIKERCIPLEIPIVSDLHLGPSWGLAEKI